MKKIIFLHSKGMAIITVLLITVLMVLMTVSMLFISTNHLSLIGNIEMKEKAQKAAESGIQYAISQLNKQRDWGLKEVKQEDFHSNGTVDFTRDNDCEEKVTYTGGSTFTITFKAGSTYKSVNNLFSATTCDDTPAYTAKIISVGECGNIKKVVQAFLVRSDYYPYSINTAGKMNFRLSSFTNIHGKSQNDPGYIYSNWQNGTSVFASDEGKVISNKGIFSARGKIQIMDPDFDGQKMEDLTQSYSMGQVDPALIVDRVARGELGNPARITNTRGLKISISEIPVPESEIPDANGVQKTSNITVAFSDPALQSAISAIPYEDKESNTYNMCLKLNQDIYISGNEATEGDRSASLLDLGNWQENERQALPKSNVFQVQVYSEALKQDLGKVWYEEKEKEGGGDDDDGEDDTETIKHVDKLPAVNRKIYMDLNGHNIYSNSHLIMGIDVYGSGTIVSKGKIAYAQGMNNDQMVCMSNDDLTIEVSERFSSCYSKGLFFASDDFNVRPMPKESILRMGGGECEDLDKIFYPSNKLSYNGNKTGIGIYKDPPPKEKDGEIVDPPPYYEGNTMTIHRETLSEEEGGGHKLVITGPGEYDPDGNTKCGNIQFYIEAPPPAKQIDFKGTIEIDFGEADASGNKVKSVKAIPYNPSDPDAAINLTEAELTSIGKQFAFYYENVYVGSADIKMDATIVGLNKYGDDDPNNTENESCLDAGSTTTGTIDIGWYPDYMKSIIFVQGKNFSVRKISWQQLE